MQEWAQDRVAVVTGGGSGIGRGIAHKLAASGAAVVAADVAEDREVARSGVTVTVIMPGVTDTAMPRQHGSEERLREQGRLNPMGRIGQPEDVAGVAAFLVSEDAAYVTGQTVAVNGGAIQLP